MLSRLPRRLPLLAALLSLAGCATQASRSEINACAAVPLQPIDQPTRARLAAEIDAAPADAVWPEQMAAYVALRAAVRACAGVRP